MNKNTSNKNCPKCGSSNILFQREQSATVGGSVHSFKIKNGHGCLYWLFIGWWIWFFKLIFHICTLGIFLIFKRKKIKMVGTTISANKAINRTMAICQNCGNTWKV